MTTLLQQAFDKATELPSEDQDRFARFILAELESERRWTELFSHPESEDLLERNSGQFSVKFLLGVMNSTFAKGFLQANRRANPRPYPDDWKTLPIPDVSAELQAPIIELVDRILKAKAADPDAYTDDFEREIDELVYDMYGLTEEESTAIERSLGLIHATDEEEDAAILKAMLDGREEARAEGYASREEVMAILRGSDGHRRDFYRGFP